MVKIVKAVLVGILSLIVAAALAVALTIVLLMNNYEADPVIQVATTFVGFWLLFFGLYLREKRIRWGAFALLGFSAVGLVVKLI